jgi:hypothetical protein
MAGVFSCWQPINTRAAASHRLPSNCNTSNGRKPVNPSAFPEALVQKNQDTAGDLGDFSDIRSAKELLQILNFAQRMCPSNSGLNPQRPHSNPGDRA